MHGFISLVMVALVLAVGIPTFSAAAEENAGGAVSAVNEDTKCAHGVSQRLCARCNPKLAAVYKAKGDWCSEHSRPESQCVICHPELATKGIK